MRKALISVGSAAAVLILAIVFGACAADGTAAGEPAPAESTTASSESKLPPPSTPSSSGVHDAGKDSGKPTTAKDAGPPAPAPGDPCAKLDEIFTRSCGACGTQTALCFSEAGGAGAVSDYSPCGGEVTSGCVAGSTETVACGNCGTQKKICDQTCKWSTSSCTQPAGACKPGGAEHTTIGCPIINTYRERGCATTCAWSPYSACAAPVNDLVVEIANTVGQSSVLGVSLGAGQTAAAIPTGGSCPAGSLLSGDYPYAYVEIRNSTTKKATVSVFRTVPAGSPSISTVLAGYKLPFVPVDDAARLGCNFGPTSSTMSSVVVEVGTSMLVYVRSFSVYNPAFPSQTTGPINLNVRTDSLL